MPNTEACRDIVGRRVFNNLIKTGCCACASLALGTLGSALYPFPVEMWGSDGKRVRCTIPAGRLFIQRIPSCGGMEYNLEKTEKNS
jgi:hypothetical protein